MLAEERKMKKEVTNEKYILRNIAEKRNHCLKGDQKDLILGISTDYSFWRQSNELKNRIYFSDEKN